MSLKPIKCWRCGEEFVPHSVAQVYCSAPECRAYAKDPKMAGERFKVRQQKRAESHEALGSRLCEYCGRRFVMLNPDETTCSGRCRLRMANTAAIKHVTAYSRTCHDCGKPTNDYRCSACLAKWRAKNHVSSWSGDDNVIY